MSGPLRLPSQNAPGRLSGAAPEPQRVTDADFGWLSIVRIVRRRALLIAIVTLAVALAALPLIMATEKTYYGQARLLFKQSPTLTLAGETLREPAQLDVQGEIERLVSHETSLAVIDRFDLENRPEFNPSLRAKGRFARSEENLRARLFPSDSANGEEPNADPLETVIQAYANSLVVSRSGSTNVVTVGFLTQDPSLAAEIPNALVEIQSDRNRERWETQVDDALQWLEAQIAYGRTRLEDSRATLDEFQKRSDALAYLEDQHQKLLASKPIAPVQIDVLSPATVPRYPGGPSRKLLLLAAIFGGLLLGLTAAGISELLDRGVRGHEQLVHLREFAPVGLLPAVRSSDRASLGEAVLSRRETKFTEALHDAVFMLECANGGVFPPSLLVTSAGNRRTSVAEWIAAELAASGRKTTLVEAGGNRNAAPSSGPVADKLERRVDRPSASVTEGAVARLALAGDPTRDPLARDAFDALMKKSSLEGLVTIVDGPPVQHGTALRIGQKVDAVLLVLEWGRTPKPVAELVAGLLTKTGIDQAFTLIVEVNPRRHRLYGFTDRMSLSAGSDSVTNPR